LGFLSEVHTDFVLAGLAEEFGFFGVLFVVVVFLLMLQMEEFFHEVFQQHIHQLFGLCKECQ
jgi:cell division protein FtsW (lipid II flippase)